MRIRILFITGIMGLAVISGIIKGLSSPRGDTKKQEEEKTPGSLQFSRPPQK